MFKGVGCLFESVYSSFSGVLRRSLPLNHRLRLAGLIHLLDNLLFPEEVFRISEAEVFF
jgi:hypothetical protein